jgi:hypothetical protein
MTSTFQTTHGYVHFSQALLAAARRIWRAIMASRQREADLRVARHIRELPDQFLERLGVPRAEIEILTNLATSETAHACTGGSKRWRRAWFCDLRHLSFSPFFSVRNRRRVVVAESARRRGISARNRHASCGIFAGGIAECTPQAATSTTAIAHAEDACGDARDR